MTPFYFMLVSTFLFERKLTFKDNSPTSFIFDLITFYAVYPAEACEYGMHLQLLVLYTTAIFDYSSFAMSHLVVILHSQLLAINFSISL